MGETETDIPSVDDQPSALSDKPMNTCVSPMQGMCLSEPYDLRQGRWMVHPGGVYEVISGCILTHT